MEPGCHCVRRHSSGRLPQIDADVKGFSCDHFLTREVPSYQRLTRPDNLHQRPAFLFQSRHRTPTVPLAYFEQWGASPARPGRGLRPPPVRPARAKGDAVRTILDEIGPEVPVAYLGDDITDERAFLALGARGLTVLVRPEWRKTAAALWIRPPEGLQDFLTRWMQASRERQQETKSSGLE